MIEMMLWLLLASLLPMEAGEFLAYFGVLERTFGKEFDRWVILQEELRLKHAVEMLPGRKIPNTLKQWLYKNGHLYGSNPYLFEEVIKHWEDLSLEQQKQIADASFLRPKHIELLISHGQYVKGLKGKTLVSRLDQVKRWSKSLRTIEPFPIDKQWEVKGFIGKFVPRTDWSRLFAGEYTGCCQKPDDAGSAAAWYAQEAFNASVFALYKEGRMVAQAFVWHPKLSKTKYDTTKICLDSVEVVNDNQEYGDKLIDCMLLAFKDLDIEEATIGISRSNVSKVYRTRYPRAKRPLNIPNDLGYSDAYKQVDLL